MSMKLSSKGAKLIHQLEESGKPALQAYKCQAGHWTIGYGHTSQAGAPDVTEGMVITAEEADSIFVSDIAPIQERLSNALDNSKVTITQEQFDALVSFAFNEGTEALLTSTAYQWLAVGKPKTSVAAALCLWLKLVDPDSGEKVVHSDLADRRYREARLFVEGNYGENI
ncbi:TPA: hypothetical protein DDW35_03815 [Candidatus Sumerlaeota bacterium]|jgi:lysozyme|nr:hypothetical protein [Candidatus Sumerlaeota bacterium]